MVNLRVQLQRSGGIVSFVTPGKSAVLFLDACTAAHERNTRPILLFFFRVFMFISRSLPHVLHMSAVGKPDSRTNVFCAQA
jgi:hypothetical protein